MINDYIAENGIVRKLFKSLYCHSEQSEGISKCLNQLEHCYISKIRVIF
jgi:hypothetical protein